MLSLIGSKERELLQKEAEIMRYQAREKVTSLRQCQQDARLSRLERELKASMRI